MQDDFTSALHLLRKGHDIGRARQIPMLRRFIAMLVRTNSDDKGYRTSCAQNLPVTPAPVWTCYHNDCHLPLSWVF